MKATTYILLAFFALVSCKAKTSVVYERTGNAEGVALLSSIAARAMERTETWETVVMKADTTGKLVPVSREVRTRKERMTENESRGDTALFQKSERQEERQEDEKAVTATETGKTARFAFVSGVWFGIAALVVLLALILIKRHGKWN